MCKKENYCVDLCKYVVLPGICRKKALDTDALIAEMDLEYIHTGALKILQEIGLELPSEETRSRITGTDGITVKGKRVFIPAELVESVVAGMRSAEYPPQSAQWSFGGGGYCHWLLDIDGEMKKFTSENLVDSIRMTSACSDLGITPCCVGIPSDYPEPMQVLMRVRIGAEYLGGFVAAGVSDRSIVEFYLEMCRVFDTKFTLGPHVISPLRLEGDEWDLAVAWLGKIEEGTVAETIYVGNMPAIGSTAPCDYNAAWAQSAAEVLGAAAVLKALGATKVLAEPCLYPFDLCQGVWTYGSAEHALITLQEAKSKSLQTSVVTPNVHAVSEKTFHTTLAAMAGYRGFSGAGVLGIDDIWSPGQLIIDADIFHSIKHIIGKEYQNQSIDIVDAVKQGIGDSNFFAADLTLQRHRQLYFSPQLFQRYALGQWLAAGKPDILKKANDIARERLETVKIEPKLDRHRARELDNIIDRARKTLVD